MTGFLAAAALWASGAFIFRNYLRLEAEEAWMASGLWFFAQACWVVVLLAHRNELYPLPVATAEILIFLAQAAAILAWRLKNPAARVGPRSFHWPSLPWPLWIATAVFAAVLAARLLLAWALPIDGWDAISYHLNMAYQWVRHGNFSLAGFPRPERYYPRNGEMLATWLAEMSGGRIEAARAYQILALPLLGLASAAIARRLAGRDWMWPCALAVMAMPFAVIQAGIPYVDLLHAAFWLCAAAAALCYERSSREIYLSFFALALGLSAGAKATVYFEAVLLIPLALIFWRESERKWKLLRLSPWLVLLSFLGGGLTYLRDWIRMGNPVYPVSVRIGAWTIFRGVRNPESFRGAAGAFIARRSMMLWYPFHETQAGKLAYSHITGAGPLFGIGWLFLPVMFWTAWKNRDRGALTFLSLCPAVLLVFLFLNPTPEMRYVLFLPPLLILGLAYVLSQTETPWKGWIIFGWSLAVIWCGAGAISAAAFGPEAAWSLREFAATGRVDPYDYYVHEYGPLGLAWKFLGPRLRPGDVVATNLDQLSLPWVGTPPRAEIVLIRWDKAESWLSQISSLHARYVGIICWNKVQGKNEGVQELALARKLPDIFQFLGEWNARGPHAADGAHVALFKFTPKNRPLSSASSTNPRGP